jgi:hypothetical protein
MGEATFDGRGKIWYVEEGGRLMIQTRYIKKLMGV